MTFSEHRHAATMPAAPAKCVYALTLTKGWKTPLLSYTRSPATMRVAGQFFTSAYASLYVPLRSLKGPMLTSAALPPAANSTENLQKLNTDSTLTQHDTTISQRFTDRTDAKWTHAHAPGSGQRNASS